MKTINYAGNSTKTGVYIIKNTINNRVYIGSTKRAFHARKVKHLKALEANTHFNIFLQSDWNKYGKDAFIFEVAVICDASECEKFENAFIQRYQSNIRRFGYNIADVAGYGAGYHISEEALKRRSIRKKGLAHIKDGLTSSERGLNKRINVYTIDGEFLFEAPSAVWLANRMRWGRHNMSTVLSHRKLLLNNHIILFANDTLSAADMDFVKRKTCKKLVNILGMDGRIIHSAITIREASEILKCKEPEIYMCCSGRRSRIGKLVTKYV